MMASAIEGGTHMTLRTEHLPVDERIRASLENLIFALADVAGADRSSLFVVDEERSELRLAVAKTDGRPLDVRMPLGHGVAGLAWRRGTPIHVDDAYAFPDFNPDVDAISGYRTRSLLCVPVRSAAGRVSAVVELLNAVDRAGFSTEDEETVCALESELSALLAACGPNA
jgi:putative methionine-R-sulfoxide reductase with GAF domain